MILYAVPLSSYSAKVPIERWQAALARHSAVHRALADWRLATERWIASRLADAA